MAYKQDVLEMLYIVRGDITTTEADAIVDPTDRAFSGMGGVDYAVHKAAGYKLDQMLRTVQKIEECQAIMTPAFDIRTARHIIHMVGPQWKNGFCHEEIKLAECYRNILKLAIENRCGSVAFPCISTGKKGFPEKRAAEIALNTVYNMMNAMDAPCLSRILFVCSSEHQEKNYKTQLARMITDEFIRLYSPESYHNDPSAERYAAYMHLLAELEWGGIKHYSEYCANFAGISCNKLSDEYTEYDRYALNMDKWDYNTCLSYIIYLQRSAYWSGGLEAPHYDQWGNGTVRKVLMRMQALRN